MNEQTFTKGSVKSEDGTTIGYRRIGSGPGLVILHGSISTSLHYSQLATSLAEHFTVYVYDRRGFGLSPYTKDFSVQQDIADVAAMLKEAKTTNLFGYSLGAIIALAAAAALPNIEKLAAYEPPLFPDRASFEPSLARLDGELAKDNRAAALVTAMTSAHLGAGWFNALPRFLLERVMKFMMTYGEREGQGGYMSFRQLAPTLRHDGQVILEESGQQEIFRKITAETILMGGEKSSKFLKQRLGELEKIIPNAKRVELPGLIHGSAMNTDFRGKPQPIADVLIDFFA